MPSRKGKNDRRSEAFLAIREVYADAIALQVEGGGPPNTHKAFRVKRQNFPGPGTMRFFDLGPGEQRRWWGNPSATRLGYPRQARLRAPSATGRAAPNT